MQLVGKLLPKVAPRVDLTRLATQYLEGAHGQWHFVSPRDLCRLVFQPFEHHTGTTYHPSTVTVRTLIHRPFVDDANPDITHIEVVGVKTIDELLGLTTASDNAATNDGDGLVAMARLCTLIHKT